jgi:hypothetical protein
VGIDRRVAELWGFCEARRNPDLPGRPGTGYRSPADFRILVATFRITQCHRNGLPSCDNSAPIDSALGDIWPMVPPSTLISVRCEASWWQPWPVTGHQTRWVCCSA